MAQVATNIPSRPTSRAGSIRSPSPSKLDHHSSIPRPFRSNSITDSVSSIPAPPPSSFSPVDISTPTRPPRSRRKSSYDTLAHLSASKDPNIDSYIPLPARTPVASDTIIEGVPLVEVKSPGTPNADNRPLTPTRTLSRIPVSAVGNARALAEENGRPRSVSPLPPTTPSSATLTNGDTLFDVGNTSLNSLVPNTPNTNGYKRLSLGGAGGTSKVLSDLQTAAIHARTALDNTRQQLRLSQRSVASLTRQVEDMKDGRERLRLENESLNNVVSRKERLLQEVLERARKAEAEVLTLKTQLKTETANAKKSVSTVTEAVAQSQKAQREYTTLRDSITGMTEGWKKEVKDLQDQMRKRDDAWREEVKEVTVKYNSLVKLVKATSAERSKVEALKIESVGLDKEFEEAMRAEIKKLSAEVARSSTDAERATQQAQGLADELAHLRSLMRAAGSTKLPPAEDLA